MTRIDLSSQGYVDLRMRLRRMRKCSFNTEVNSHCQTYHLSSISENISAICHGTDCKSALNLSAFQALIERVVRQRCFEDPIAGPCFKTPKIGKWSLNEVDRTPAELNTLRVDVISTSNSEKDELVTLLGSVISCESSFAIINFHSFCLLNLIYITLIC